MPLYIILVKFNIHCPRETVTKYNKCYLIIKNLQIHEKELLERHLFCSKSSTFIVVY